MTTPTAASGRALTQSTSLTQPTNLAQPGGRLRPARLPRPVNPGAADPAPADSDQAGRRLVGRSSRFGRFTHPTRSAGRPTARLSRFGRLAHSRPARLTQSVSLVARRRADWLALAILLLASAAVFFVNLTASGYANEFYSAAAQAGSTNWEAFLWGSSDAGNSITVDKPPAALWLMALSVRLFGLSSFAILLPQALLGLASVYLTYALTRRYWGNWTGIVAGAVLALTPVAALMFRFNNPDALLVFLMLAAAYAVLRSLEYETSRRGNRTRTRWLLVAGACVGFGFLTKQLQVFLVLPGFVLAVFWASPTGWLRRVVDCLAALAALVVSAGWWVLLTVIVPAGSRPYFGGSQNNSFLELTFGYNGLGRITGNETGSVVPGGGSANSGGPGGSAGSAGNAGNAAGGMWGQTGITRLFGSEFAGQIAWLAPVALVGLVLALVVVGRSVRTDLRRASVMVMGSWLVVTWLVFSFMAGIFHQYYTVALAPALAVLVAVFAKLAWERRSCRWMSFVVALTVMVTAVWGWTILGQSSWLPWLRWAVLGLGLVSGLLIGLTGLVLKSKRLAIGAFALAGLALGAGPAAWTVYTVSTGHSGSIVTAGPAVQGSMGGFGGGPGGAGAAAFGGPGGGGAGGGFAGIGGPVGGFGSDGGGQGNSGSSGFGPGGPGSSSGNGSGSGSSQPGSATGSEGVAPTGPTGMGETGGSGLGGSGGGNRTGQPGGLLGGGSVSSSLVALLKTDSADFTWVAAATGSQSAASYQLATGLSVMPIGGFNGSDPSPSLSQFKAYVKAGRIHYYIATGGMSAGSRPGSQVGATESGDGTLTDGEGSAGSLLGGSQMGGSQSAAAIQKWVEATFKVKSVDGVTLYDLTSKK